MKKIITFLSLLLIFGCKLFSVDASKWQSGTYIWELKTENGKLKIEEGKWVK